VWSGDPLEVTEAAEMVIINGQFVDMESRQTKLRDRYLSLMQSDAKKPSYYYR
ncbi:MAG TPA: amidohydrolase, partial [Alteromonas australica]|nr:amidohydrolase [Alteromonas australica]